MAFTTFLTTLAAGLLISLPGAFSYGGAENLGCANGGAECTSFSTTLGVEFANVDINGTVVTCKFGFTSVGDLPNTRCESDCDSVTEYECACVSEEDAKKGLETDSLPLFIGGIIALVLLFPVAAYHYKVKQQKKKKEEWQSKGMNLCWFWLLELALLVTFIVIFQQVFEYRAQDFWEGCV